MATIKQIDYDSFLHAYNLVNSLPDNYKFFIEIIKKYKCFNEKNDIKYTKWKHNYDIVLKQQPTPTVYVKKIGGSDISDEGIFKKELVSILNKTTLTNLDVITVRIIDIFKLQHMNIFVNTLWSYFKLQPVYQSLYIKLLENVYNTLSVDNIVNMNILWTAIWNSYIKEDQWKISYELIEQSHSYDDFCEYIKEKKKLNALAEGWSRLIILGIVNTELWEWVNNVLIECNQLDLTNVVYKSTADSYIEQIRDYSKNMYDKVPLSIIDKLELLATRDLQKATKFKIQDYIESVKKMKKN